MTYIYEAGTKGYELGALADINFEWAKNRAKEMDKELQEGKCRGPLHGIPISVKDELILAGTVSTNGLASKSDNLNIEDGLCVEAFKLQGAIPFTKTNVPQLVMIPETDNNVFGRCDNPHDITRTPGGSSGGEACLIGAKCSPFGLGTDIGGSVRIPAACCNIYGFKPS